MKATCVKARLSKLVRFPFVFGAALWLVAPRTVADEACFFRIVGPTATTITAFTPDGYITWTNAQVGSNYTVQIARSLGAATNWVDYIQVPASNSVISHRLYDPNPPSGMALIPAGSFTMGNCMGTNEGPWPSQPSSELPLHSVYVSAFYMETNLVSRALWQQVYQWATNHGYDFDYPGAGKATNHPVQEVTWFSCVKWCNARSEMEGRVPAYYTNAAQTVVYRTGRVYVANAWVNWSVGYRLPTEAEWEKAARGGLDGQRFPWGNTIWWVQANYVAAPSVYPYDVNYPPGGYNPAFTTGGYPYTNPVGIFAPNGYGLHDMAGNLCQWCWDWYYYYPPTSQIDPRGPVSSSGLRVLRGGCWDYDASHCRTAYRLNSVSPVTQNHYIGFRCVLPPSQ